MFSRLPALFAAVVVSLCTAWPAAAAPALWRADKDGATVWLFGAMHVLKPGAAWRTPTFDAAYAAADAVWFETDATADAAVVQALLEKYGVDRSRPLADKLSARGRRDLKPLLRRSGVTPERLAVLRPWAAALTLSVAPMVEAQGYRVSAGADAVITRKAQNTAKSVRLFETLEQQMSLFAQLPAKVEVQYLEDVLSEQARPPRDGVALQKAWLAGDVARLDRLLVDRMRRERPALYDTLLRRRNFAWVDALSAAVQPGRTELVNVGALHLAGEEGLPALLTARGWSVRRVQ